jgi:hypothetical protein
MQQIIIVVERVFNKRIKVNNKINCISANIGNSTDKYPFINEGIL